MLESLIIFAILILIIDLVSKIYEIKELRKLTLEHEKKNRNHFREVTKKIKRVPNKKETETFKEPRIPEDEIDANGFYQ